MMTDLYGEQYYKSCCGKDYSDEPHWKAFFGHIAKKIVDDFAPKTVLDAGCAWGYLVAALRDLGVEAYGVDVSDYAISKVREDVKLFCAVVDLAHGLPEHFPKNFDLITSIEVLEHMKEESCLTALENLCCYGDRVIFSSSPDDITEETHYNVQQIEYWTTKFAMHGFFRVLSYRPDYIAPWAIMFEKKSDVSTKELIFDYEHQMRIQKAKWDKRIRDKDNHIEHIEVMLTDKEQHISSLAEALESKEQHINGLAKELENNAQQNAEILGNLNNKEQHILNLDTQIHALHIRSNEYLNAYNAMLRSYSWKITKPIRFVSRIIKKIMKSIPGIKFLYKGIVYCRHNGLKATLSKAKHRFSHKADAKKYIQNQILSDQEKEQQRNTVFSKNIKFSILVPLYNTPVNFLMEMIESVQAQTYTNWELCLADGSEQKSNDVEKVCKKYAKKDDRIKYKKLDKNYGISGNTNQCIEMATGDYIGLFDHDDLLHPAALFEVMKAITEKEADFIYTDEMTFEGDLMHPITMHFKPDFAIDNLRANNYICHFSCFSKALLDKVGLFRSEFDGSQDYDIILRLTEQAKNIVHIPKILYYWRSHPSSVASDISTKPYCITAGKGAINDHLSRCGIKGIAVEAPHLTSTYRIKYTLTELPLVSIIIPNRDHVDDLRRCINSIRNATTYDNWEIIIVENNSEDKNIFEYYQELCTDSRIRVVYWDKAFNFSAVNNFAVSHAEGSQLVFLNNDTEIITPQWIEELLMYAQREDVGAVGLKLYYPDHTIKHAGVVIGLAGSAGRVHYKAPKDNLGYMGRLFYSQNFSAVTAACMMVRKDIFIKVKGFDESFVIAYNDVDFCLKLRQIGKLNVFTPFAQLYHYESVSRGNDQTSENIARWRKEEYLFKTKWKDVIDAGDPYYNPNFRLDRDDFSIKF
jgi:GT2 family glycosyltransferase